MMPLKVLGMATRTQVQRKGRLFAALFVFLLAAALYSFGQEATIIGTVTDSSGAALPNVAVAITSVETGTVRSSTTNDTGQYVAPGLPIGRYNVSAKAAGFSAAETNDVVLNVGDRIRVDFALKVGRIQEQVTVEANAVEVQTDSGVQSTVITGAQVANLGANGRSIYSLFSLAPGASSVQGDLVIPTAVSGDSNVSINGQRPGHNLQLLDGGENLDRGGSSASVMPSMDAIAEFANMTSNYDAEYGLSSAAMITTAIKSGTKQFHAEAWWNGRNDALDARNYFNPAPAKVAELRFNVYGFNAGGQAPLWKEHPTFFFYNMEWRSEIDGGLLNLPVPLASEYPTAAGAVIPASFNGKTNPIAVPNGSPAFLANEFANCPGGTAAGAGVTPGAPFPNNTIPSCMISPNSAALLVAGGKYGGIFPLPNSGDFFKGGNNTPTDLREEIFRID